MEKAHRHPNPETRFNRRAWLTLVVAMALLIYGIAVFAYRLTLPTDGWEIFEGNNEGIIYTKNLMGFPSGLQTGDMVIALEGSKITRWNIPYNLRQAWRVGATIDYTVLRDGQEIQVPVTLENWQIRKLLKGWLRDPFTLAGRLPNYLLLFLAAIVFFRRPGNLSARAFLLLFAIFVSNELVTASIPRNWPEIIDPAGEVLVMKPAVLFLTILLPSVLIFFALVFPHPKPIFQRRPWLAYVPIIIGAIIAFFPGSDGNPVGWFWFLFSLVLTVAIMLHNAFSMRDSVSRAQLRWGLGGLIFNFSLVTFALFASTFELIKFDPAAFTNFFNLVNAVGISVMGASLAIAITRYRLFDIDVIIRKTLVYTLLSGTLGLVYFGGVVVLQNLLTANRVAQAGSSVQLSPIVIVITTLAIAALFNPLRRRLQEMIDRRFYRQKYDAEKALEGFASVARSETSLPVLTNSLVSVVHDTVQPDEVRLWLKRQDNQTEASR